MSKPSREVIVLTNWGEGGKTEIFYKNSGDGGIIPMLTELRPDTATKLRAAAATIGMLPDNPMTASFMMSCDCIIAAYYTVDDTDTDPDDTLTVMETTVLFKETAEFWDMLAASIA